MKLILLFFTIISLNASTNISKSWLVKQERSYAKDFYISLYLKQNISPDDAIWALGQANRVNNKLLYPYAKALKHKETSEVIRCKRKATKNLYNESASCIELGLTLYKTVNLNKKNINTLIKKLEKPYPRTANKLKIIKSKTPFIDLKKSSNQTFFDVFNNAGTKFRNKHFNRPLALEFLNKLQKNKARFSSMIKKIVINNNLYKLQKSLLYINPSQLNHKTQFFLAINAIKHNKNKIALIILEHSFKSAYYKMDKDKVLFWQYQLSQNKKYLNELSLSWDNNIYSLYAKEKNNIQITNIKTSNDIDLVDKTSYDYKDPFEWLKVLSDIKKDLNKTKLIKYKKLFNTKQTQAHLFFVNERYNSYKYTYLPNPYKDLIKKYPIKRQVLINAIARQESRFIPSSISSAYALGVMQIMPFLSKDIAKQLNEPYDIFKQLEAPTNIRYSNFHLNFLQRRLNHILFVAYAYNGGLGFTKRKIFNAGLFKKGKYEPYLSMELVPYSESNKYGKKVLANYYLYNNYINKKNPIKFSDLIKTIKNPNY